MDKSVIFNGNNSRSANSIFGRLRFIAKDTLLYGIATAVSKTLSIITFPLLARNFSVQDFGLIDIYTTFSLFLAAIIVLGQDSAIVRFYYEQKNDDSRKQLISQSLLYQLIMSLIALPILWYFKFKLSSFIPVNKFSDKVIQIIILQLPFQIMIFNAQALLQYSFKRIRFLTLSLGYTLFTILGYLMGIFLYKVNVEFIFLVNLITTIIFSFIGLFFIRKWLVIPKKFTKLPLLLKYAVPMGLIVSISTFQPYLERTIISSYTNAENLGIYAAGVKISLFIALPITAFQAAWGPFMISTYKQPDASNIFNWLLKILVLLLSIFVLLLTAFSDKFLSILGGGKYAAASVVVFPLTIGLVLQAVALFTGMGTILAVRTHLRLFSYSLSILVTVSLMFFLVKPLGILGISVAVMCGHFTKCLSESYFGQRNLPFPWEYSGISVILFITTFVGIVAPFIILSSVQRTIIYLSTIPFLLFLSWFILFSKFDRKKLVSLFLVIFKK